jgi:hypothetical protein
MGRDEQAGRERDGRCRRAAVRAYPSPTTRRPMHRLHKIWDAGRGPRQLKLKVERWRGEALCKLTENIRVSVCVCVGTRVCVISVERKRTFY